MPKLNVWGKNKGQMGEDWVNSVGKGAEKKQGLESWGSRRGGKGLTKHAAGKKKKKATLQKNQQKVTSKRKA